MLLPISSLSLPNYLQPKGIVVSDQSGLGQGTNLSRKLCCWRPQRQLCSRTAGAKQGGSGRLLAFPFNRNNALFASRQKGVSLGQRVREGGIPGGEPAGGREGGQAGDSYLAFNAPGEKADLCKTEATFTGYRGR